MTKTLEAVVRKRWLPPKYAVREVVAFERRFGKKHLALACHAALPLILTPELVNLIRINFLDNKDIPWIAESDLLLSPLCRPIQEGFYEVEPTIREVLLVELEDKFGWRKPFELAEFLEFYLDKQPDWKQRPELTRTQKWIAKAYLDPDSTVRKIKDRLEESLPEDNPVLGLPDQSYIPHLVEILSEPLERTNLWNEHQYLVNTTRALSKLLSGEREGLREEIGLEGVEHKAKEGELMLISPAISRLLQDIKVEAVKTNSQEFIDRPSEPEPILVGRVVILTAISVEYSAVRSHLTDIRKEILPQGTVYERGKFIDNDKFWDVGVVEVGVANSRSAFVAEQAISYFNPDIVLSIGIAAGIKDVSFGDVVFATKIYGYDSGQIEINFNRRADVEQSTYRLIQSAKENWLTRLNFSETISTPNAYVAPIAVGEKLFTSQEFSNLELYGDAVALEMEGLGFIQATNANQKVSTFIIRGISDLINNQSKDRVGSQETAAHNAISFAFEFLAKLEPDWVDWANWLLKDKSSSQQTAKFFAYDNAWLGREKIINDLSHRIQESCRLLILLGITGIGKTALGERLSIELENWFYKDWNNYLREEFDNEEQSSDFVNVAIRLLEKNGSSITSEERQKPQLLLHRLVRHLRENRYLVQIDSLEKILEGNEEEGWSDFKDQWWVEFFQNLLNADYCNSCIILTSEDFPAQVDPENRFENFSHYQLLSGLEKQEQLALFKKTGLDVDSKAEEKTYLERIGSTYEGHPLALRVIAGEIVNRPFNKNITAYWKRYGKEVEEVEKAIEEAQSGGAMASADDEINLHQFTRNLRTKVRTRLENTYKRLRKDVRNAYLLLCESSVYRCEVTEDFWLSHLEDWDVEEDERYIALDTLRDRFLVEERVDESDRIMVRQHNLIRSVSLEHLKKLDEEEEADISNQDDKEENLININFEPNIAPSGTLILTELGIELGSLKSIKPRWKRQQYRAIINWLTQYKPSADASNLETVKGLLEAFYHLCTIEDWEKARKIFVSRLNTPTNEELYSQLGTWGYYQEQIRLCNLLLGKLDSNLDIKLLTTLGNSYYALGNYSQAIDYLQQSLKITQQINNSLEESEILSNLGKVYEALGNYSQAIDYLEYSLSIARENEYHQEESQALSNLAIVYYDTANYSQSIDYSEQSLNISRQIQDRQTEGISLGNLGNVSLAQGNYQRAINYYQQYLEIARKTEDRFHQGRCIGTLGNAYKALENYQRAIDYYQQSLIIAKEIGDRRNEAIVLINLAYLQQMLGDSKLAMEYCDRALTIATELNLPLVEECQKLKNELMEQS